MSNSNVQEDEFVINRGGYFCIFTTLELEALSSNMLREVRSKYRSEGELSSHLFLDGAYVASIFSVTFTIDEILARRKSNPVVHFFDQDCDLLVGKYGNGTTSLRLFSNGPVATATVCLPEVLLPEGYVLIKDYDENTGVLAALVFSGIVKDTGQTYPVGRFNHANFCRLTL